MTSARQSAAFSRAVSFGTLLAGGFCAFLPQSAQGAQTYPPEAIREDLVTLYRNLQDSAYDLFIFTDKAEYDAEYERLLATIAEPMTAREAGRLFQGFVVMARMSHCTMGLPVEAYRNWYRSGGRFIPFDLVFDGDRPLIATDWSRTDGIDPGDEILAIHGMEVGDFIEELFRLEPGENDQAKRANLETGGLWSRYWYVFGDFEEGPVRVRKRNGRVAELNVSGIDIEQYRILSDSLSEPEFMKDSREFRFIGDVAYLRPGPFMSLSSSDLSEQETWDNTEFRTFMDSVFTQVAAMKSENLIVDLRGNRGGSSTFSNPFIAFLADRSFREGSTVRYRTSRITKEFWRDVDDPSLADLRHEILTRADGERWDEVPETYGPRGDSLRFEGKVFALIDRFSFSNAAAVAAILQDYEFATLIGEETSFNPSNCGGTHTFNLPHTQLEVVYPKLCGVRPSGDASTHGVIPDHEVRQDYFTDEDEVLEGALRIIRESGG